MSLELAALGGEPALRLLSVLGHSLWQGGVVAVALLLLLRRLPGSRPHVRYALACAALLLVIMAAGATWALTGNRYVSGKLLSTHALQLTNPTATAAATTVVDLPPTETFMPPLPPPVPGRVMVSGQLSMFDTWQSCLLTAWFAGVILMLIRTGRDVVGATQLAARSTVVSNATVVALLEELRTLMGVRRTLHLKQSGEISGPAVLGALWPVILLPASILSGFPPEALRAILAHELAHVRRHDYLVNLGQMIVEALLFFNPAVWWISGQIRLEREASCDQLAASVIQDPAIYADALATAAERSMPSLALPRAAMAHTPRSRGALLERVRRVLVPGHRPSVRLPWYSLVTTMVGWLAIIAALWGGSTAAVTFAARALTPEERLTRVKEDEAKFGVPVYHRSGKMDDLKSTVSGTIRTSTGVPVPKTMQIFAWSHSPRGAYGTGIIAVDGKFSGAMPVGRVKLAAKMPEHAPILMPPIDLRPGEQVEGLDMVLEAGHQSEIMVTNEEDVPLSGAQVVVKLSWKEGSSMGTLFTDTYLSNARGIVSLKHLTDAPLELIASLPDYEQDFRPEERLAKNGRLTWRLRRADPAEGLVVEKATGRAIPGAVLRMIRSHGPPHAIQSNNIENATTATIAGADGRFRLRSLREDCQYLFLVEAPPYRRAWLADVSAGTKDLRVEMGAPLYIKGTINGDPEMLRQWDWRAQRRLPVIRVTNRIAYPAEQRFFDHENRLVAFDIRDGVGHYYVDNLFEGEVTLHVHGRERQEIPLKLTDPIENLVLHTDPPDAAGAKKLEAASTRTVVLRFLVPDGAPPPAGTMHLNYEGNRVPGETYTSPLHPIAGRDHRIVVRTPSSVSYSPDGMLGYWFERGSQQIPVGEGDFAIPITVRPAGSISGVLLGIEGHAATAGSVSVRVNEKPPGVKHSFDLIPTSISINNNGQFHVTPLPLGGSYTIVAQQDNNFVISDPIRLTESAPARSASVQFLKGSPIEVRVVDKQGLPVRAVPAQVGLHIKDHSRYHLTEQATDRDGRIRVENINPSAAGEYLVEIKSRHKYQPVKMKIKPGTAPVQIALEPGSSMEGVVVSETTGKPVPGATVFAAPGNSDMVNYETWAQVLAEDVTDDQGRFRFSNLGPHNYNFRVKDANSDDGFYAGDRPTSVTLRVKNFPGSPLHVP